MEKRKTNSMPTIRPSREFAACLLSWEMSSETIMPGETGDTTRRYPSLIRVNNRVRRRPCLTSNRSGLRRFVLCVRARHTFHAPSNDLVWKSGKKTTEKNIIKHITNWIQYITRIIYNIHTHSLCVSLSPGVGCGGVDQRKGRRVTSFLFLVITVFYLFIFFIFVCFTGLRA